MGTRQSRNGRRHERREHHRNSERTPRQLLCGDRLPRHTSGKAGASDRESKEATAMSETGKQIGWAIIGKSGLYVDWRQTRLGMIAKHVHDKCGCNEEQPSEFVSHRKLDPLQRERWERCRSQGDKAVKVTITW